MSTEFRCRACSGYGIVGRNSSLPCPSCGGSGLSGVAGSRDAGDRSSGAQEQQISSADRRRGQDLHVDLALAFPAGVTNRAPRKTVTLPDGIGAGTVLRLRRLGLPGEVGRGDLYLHIQAATTAAPTGDIQPSDAADRAPSVSAAVPQGPLSDPLPSGVTAEAPPLTEEDAARAVSSYFSLQLPGQAPVVTFVWRCDHGDRSRCSAAAVWHVRANDQVCTVYEDGRVEPTFASLLSLKDVHRPSYEELAVLNAELGLKSPEAIGRLLDTMEKYASWDAQSRRFVCPESGWVTTVQALDYYVDDPGLWEKRAEAAWKAAIDDEMEEWERAMPNAALERFTALFTVGATGAAVRATTGAARSGARTVPEAPDTELSRAQAS